MQIEQITSYFYNEELRTIARLKRNVYKDEISLAKLNIKKREKL